MPHKSCYYVIYMDIITFGRLIDIVDKTQVVGSKLMYVPSEWPEPQVCPTVDAVNTLVRGELVKYSPLRDMEYKDLMYNDIINFNMYAVYERKLSTTDDDIPPQEISPNRRAIKISRRVPSEPANVTVSSVSPYMSKLSADELQHYVDVCEHIQTHYANDLSTLLGPDSRYCSIEYLHNCVKTVYKGVIMMFPPAFKFIMIDTLEDVDMWGRLNDLCNEYNVSSVSSKTLHTSMINNKRCVVSLGNVSMIDMLHHSMNLLTSILKLSQL